MENIGQVNFVLKDGESPEILAVRIRVLFSNLDTGQSKEHLKQQLERIRDMLREGDIYTVDGNTINCAVFGDEEDRRGA